MQSQETLKRHAALVDRMANALGVDLEEAVLRGDMPVDAVGDAVLRCTGCTNPQNCESWLPSSDEKRNAAPGYCRNNELWATLLPEEG